MFTDEQKKFRVKATDPHSHQNTERGSQGIQDWKGSCYWKSCYSFYHSK